MMRDEESADTPAPELEDDRPGAEAAHFGTRWKYTGMGFLLGLGAPAGALVLRLMLVPEALNDPTSELRTHAFFYIYSLVSTCVVFSIAGRVAGIRAENLRNAEEFYHRLSEHDALTGLLNAGAFHDRYRRALGRVRKFREPVSLLLVDVDNLKRINDGQGHARGSAALVLVADSIRNSKRASDEAARWGGDEFAVLIEGGDVSAAIRTAEAIMQTLARVSTGDSPPVTVTIGIASSSLAHADDDLFAAADQALYSGKSAGRNQFRVAESVDKGTNSTQS